MQTNPGHQSIKDKIVSHLPGHNRDANHNGVPDRLERNSGFGGVGGMNDLNRNGIPDSMERGQGFGQGFGAVGGFNDLNRNGIPDSMEGGQYRTGLTDFNRDGIPDQFQQQSFTSGGIVDVRQAPTVVQTIEKPAVVHEVIRTEEMVEVQPVIQREREKLDVYEVVQPMREREVVATEVRTGVLPAQTRATLVEDQSAFMAQRSMPGEFSTREVAPTLHQTYQNAPIVHETIHHKVIEEVQPVIYKEIDRPILVKETLPIYEKVVEAPHVHHTSLPVRDFGTSYAQNTTFATDLNRNGIPDQLERGMAYQTGPAVIGVPTETVREVITTHVTTTTGDRIGRDHSADYAATNTEKRGLKDKLTSRRHKNQDKNANGIPDRMESSRTY